MLAAIGIILVAVIAGLLLFANSRPNTFRIERATVINAPPGKLFGLVDDLRAWASWSPFEKLDPAMKRIFSGAPSGVGAAYDWDGNRRAGQGRMEITESTPSSKVTIKLDFTRPFVSHNMTVFTIVPNGDTSLVTWSMEGPNSLMGKVMGIFVNMDAMLGKDFATGLANMKVLAEGVGRGEGVASLPIRA